jgi:hypothetical protein
MSYFVKIMFVAVAIFSVSATSVMITDANAAAGGVIKKK